MEPRSKLIQKLQNLLNSINISMDENNCKNFINELMHLDNENVWPFNAQETAYLRINLGIIDPNNFIKLYLLGQKFEKINELTLSTPIDKIITDQDIIDKLNKVDIETLTDINMNRDKIPAEIQNYLDILNLYASSNETKVKKLEKQKK